MVPVLIGLAIILAAAKIGGEIFERIGQPAVLGELVMGVVLGNIALLGWDGFEFLGTNTGIEILAQIGVILLLFDVGLESNVKEMLSVGASSLLVAVLGVIAPFFLGWWMSALFLPEEELLVHMFIGATLCATSVGITARVLTDLGKISARESKIILGAAVIDDILGLVILAVVTGVISAANTGGELATLDVLMIVDQGGALPRRRHRHRRLDGAAHVPASPASCASAACCSSPRWSSSSSSRGRRTRSASPPSSAPSPPA